MAPVDPDTRELAAAIARGDTPADAAFDRLLPEPLRMVSPRFWTPLPVVAQVVAWLDELALTSLVDIGSGAGKLCVAGALASPARRFIGLEHRPHLIAAARELASRFAVADRVTFVPGAFDPRTLPRADAYYVFNPFGENIAATDEHLDDTVTLDDDRYARDVAAMEAFLAAAPVGTRVIVYNGFGGRMPPGYESTFADFEQPQVLRLWTRIE